MSDLPSHAKGNVLGTVARLFGGLLVVGLCAAILYPIFAPATSTPRNHCLSHLRQLGTSVAIYQSDFDDCLPLHYTFDGAKASEKFTQALFVYLKNDESFLCSSQQVNLGPGPEELFPKLSYVHPRAFMRIIPNFDQGKRLVDTVQITADPATTVYLRDPLRVAAKEEDRDKLCSPHGIGFYVEFLDTHVKFHKTLDINTEL
jgi:hypothetical protein